MVLLRTQKFGASIRKTYEAALRSKKAKYECPKCGKRKVKRITYAVWECNSCKNTFAGAAYTLSSEAGNISARLIREYGKLS